MQMRRTIHHAPTDSWAADGALDPPYSPASVLLNERLTPIKRYDGAQAQLQRAPDRTRSLMPFAILLHALKCLSATTHFDMPSYSHSDAIVAVANAYAITGFCKLDINLAVSLRPSSPVPDGVSCDAALASGFVLQVAYNDSVATEHVRIAHSQLCALVALLRARQATLAARPDTRGPCTICTTNVGCAEDEVIDYFLACSAEVIDRRINRGRKSIMQLLEGDYAPAQSHQRVCTCGRWTTPYEGCAGWTALSDLVALLKQWDARTIDLEAGLRKMIVFAARAVAVAEAGSFLKETSRWTQHLLIPELSLATYVARLAQLSTAIVDVMRHPPPVGVELVGDGSPAFDFPSVSEMCTAHGAAALHAAGLAPPTHHAILEQCFRALSKQTQPILSVPVHAEVKLLVHWLEQASCAPLGNYIASSRKPCFSCAAFFHAARAERGTYPPANDSHNLIHCAPSSLLIHPRWQFPDVDFVMADGQCDKVRAEKIYKRMRLCFRRELAQRIGLPLPV